MSTRAIDISKIIIKGDLSELNTEERKKYYLEVCNHLGLTAATQPFSILQLNGKTVLYPNRTCTDQLAAIHRLNREIIDGPKVVEITPGYKVVYALCRVTLPNKRVETSVATCELKDHLNVLMKTETKAKRRATLSILGLGTLADTMEEYEDNPKQKKENIITKVEKVSPELAGKLESAIVQTIPVVRELRSEQSSKTNADLMAEKLVKPFKTLNEWLGSPAPKTTVDEFIQQLADTSAKVDAIIDRQQRKDQVIGQMTANFKSNLTEIEEQKNVDSNLKNYLDKIDSVSVAELFNFGKELVTLDCNLRSRLISPYQSRMVRNIQVIDKGYLRGMWARYCLLPQDLKTQLDSAVVKAFNDRGYPPQDPSKKKSVDSSALEARASVASLSSDPEREAIQNEPEATTPAHRATLELAKQSPYARNFTLSSDQNAWIGHLAECDNWAHVCNSFISRVIYFRAHNVTVDRHEATIQELVKREKCTIAEANATLKTMASRVA